MVKLVFFNTKIKKGFYVYNKYQNCTEKIKCMNPKTKLKQVQNNLLNLIKQKVIKNSQPYTSSSKVKLGICHCGKWSWTDHISVKNNENNLALVICQKTIHVIKLIPIRTLNVAF